MRLIDADALEREGWSLYRNYQQDKKTMVYESKSIVEIPTAQPDVPDKSVGDMISRQAAINALADMHCKSDEDGYVWIIRSDAWARIDALPSAQPSYTDEQIQKMQELEQAEIEKAFQLGKEDAQPERKKGKWKPDRDNERDWYCSECDYIGNRWFPFCPNCGADMRGEKNETD